MNRNKAYLILSLLFCTSVLYANPTKFFELDQQGFIRYWYNSGIDAELYTQAFSEESRDMKATREAVVQTPISFAIPKGRAFNPQLSEKVVLKLYATGNNIYVENFDFYFKPTVIQSYSLTQLEVEKEMEVLATIMYESELNIWCNGIPVERQKTETVRGKSFQLHLKLQAGTNQLFIRQIDLAAWNNPCSFALRIDTHREEVKVSLPGNQQAIETFYGAEQWLKSIVIHPDGWCEAQTTPLSDVTIKAGGQTLLWKKEEKKKKIMLPTDSYAMKVTFSALAGNTELSKEFEINNLNPLPPYESTSPNSYQQLFTQKILDPLQTDPYAEPGAITLKLLQGEKPTKKEYDKLYEALLPVNERRDCADFHLGFLVRLYKLCANQLNATYRSTLKEAILNFRYWPDEKGNDSMWFWSENHRILFHSAQLVAGKLFPHETFTAGNKRGKEQAQIAIERIKQWMTEIEAHGFEEFQSSDYQTVTLLGMFNVLDFCEDATIRQRMNRLIDQMFRRSLYLSFDGLCSGPQGRIYCKSATNPEATGKQAIVSYLTTHMRPCFNLWTTALISSTYQVPSDFETLATCVLDTTYIEGGTEIAIKRTANYFLSSVTLPSPLKERAPKAFIYTPGRAMAQQHLWEAALSARARVFVTHPGASNEFSNNRPGYWGGNAIAPTLRMRDNMIVEIFNTPDTYPIHFTHAYFPSTEFDNVVYDSHWVFAAKEKGFIALWCSEPLSIYPSAYVNKELRAYGSQLAWLCFTSSTDQDADLAAFAKRLKSATPAFNRQTMVVEWEGKPLLGWGDTVWRK